MIEKFPSIRQAVVYCTHVEAGRKVRENEERISDKRWKRKEKMLKRNRIKELGKTYFK